MPVTNGILIFTPAALTGPLLATMVSGLQALLLVNVMKILQAT
jgi:hypothetical protein